jgi:hypothetical protein
MSIQEKAMLVKLTIHQWGATKQDSKKTDDICKQNGTTKEWLRANKSLLPKEATAPLTSELGAAYRYHCSVTLPWDDLGFRVLPASLYEEYQKTVNAHQEKTLALARKLGAEMPRWKQEARQSLNGAFDEDDYPDDIASRYGIDMTVRPIPAGEDLRVVNVDSKDLSRLRESINSQVMEQINESVKDLWARLRQRVSQAAIGFKDGKVLFECWVDNLKEVTDILPKLNITGDKDLNDMTKQVKEKLAALDINAIRGDKNVRAQAANTAAATLKKLDAVMKRRKIDLDLE